MPRQLPVREAQLLEFARVHGPLWLERHTEIGLREELAEKHNDEAEALKQAAAARAAAELALRAARDAYTLAEETYRHTAQACISTITSLAGIEPNRDAILITADLHTPRSAHRNRPPAQPESLRASLDTVSGVLTLEWDGNTKRSGRGTFYIVRRRLNAGDVWQEFGHVSRPRFVDASLPAGISEVEYQVVARRASQPGVPSAPLIVRIGGGASVEPPAVVVHPSRSARAA